MQEGIQGKIRGKIPGIGQLKHFELPKYGLGTDVTPMVG